MTIKEIIDGLQFTIDMFLFDGNTGEMKSKHLLNDMDKTTVDACEGAIKILKEVPTGKWITTKQLEDMYKKFERKLWNEREDVRGDDMVEIGFAEQFLQDGLMELGCWDDVVEEQQGENVNENNMS